MKAFVLNIVLVCLLPMFFSCSKIWDEKRNNDWDEKYIWNNPEIASGVLHNAYKAIMNRPDGYDGNFLDAATDNAVTSAYGSDIYNLSHGNYSVKANPIANWSTCYQQFQYINSFLENGLGDNIKYDRVDEKQDEAYKKRLKGEAYFLRAFWGFQLLKVYGGKSDSGVALGYPISIHFITQEDASVLENIRRDTYEACVEQILADCRVAEDCLPDKYEGADIVVGATEIGRATRLAALALKSSVSLYAASPAYQDDDCVKLLEMGKFTVEDETKYNEKWERAALIADSLIKEPKFGATFTALKAGNLADAPNTTPAEFLMRVFHSSNSMESRHFPPYYLGKANTVPSQNLVDAFPMKNGYPIDDVLHSGYNKDMPYEDRDNRFYLNIYYHGAKFGDSAKTIDVSDGGTDSQSYSRYASKTGYYLAKFMSQKSGLLNPISSSSPQHYYPYMRRAEVFLNFAEAANEAWGPKNNPKSCKYSAYDVIKMIRKISGGIDDTGYLDEMASNKDSFRKLIQNERRIELAFENHRYFDMRRWLLRLDDSVYGVKVSGSEGHYEFDTDVEIEKRPFNDVKYYYSPLPYDECVKNPNLENNAGWK